MHLSILPIDKPSDTDPKSIDVTRRLFIGINGFWIRPSVFLSDPCALTRMGGSRKQCHIRLSSSASDMCVPGTPHPAVCLPRLVPSPCCLPAAFQVCIERRRVCYRKNPEYNKTVPFFLLLLSFSVLAFSPLYSFQKRKDAASLSSPPPHLKEEECSFKGGGLTSG